MLHNTWYKHDTWYKYDTSYTGPQNVRNGSYTTHSPWLRLAGCLPVAKPSGHDWPRLSYKESKQFNWQKSLSLWPSPGDKAWGPCLVSASSPAPGLSALILLDGNVPGFSSTAKASLPAIAGRQTRISFAQIWHRFHKSNIFIYFWFQVESDKLSDVWIDFDTEKHD